MRGRAAARSWARALFDLGRESRFDPAGEVGRVVGLADGCPEFGSLLFLDVFTPEEKGRVLGECAPRIPIGRTTERFLSLLFLSRRARLLPLIQEELLRLGDLAGGRARGTIEGRDEAPDPALAARLKDVLGKGLRRDVEFVYKRTGRVAAGYRVTVEDLMLDASLDRQLDDFTKSVLGA